MYMSKLLSFESTDYWFNYLTQCENYMCCIVLVSFSPQSNLNPLLKKL